MNLADPIEPSLLMRNLAVVSFRAGSCHLDIAYR